LPTYPPTYIQDLSTWNVTWTFIRKAFDIGHNFLETKLQELLCIIRYWWYNIININNVTLTKHALKLNLYFWLIACFEPRFHLCVLDLDSYITKEVYFVTWKYEVP
jgi:hypothetical protein